MSIKRKPLCELSDEAIEVLKRYFSSPPIPYPEKRIKSRLASAYQADASLKRYAELRREYPDAPFDVRLHPGHKYVVVAKDRLIKEGIDPSLYLWAIDVGDRERINELARALIDKILQRKNPTAESAHAISRGIAVSNTLISFLIVGMLETLHNAIPQDLLVLIRAQLGWHDRENFTDFERHAARLHAVWTAARMCAEGEKVTCRSLASKINKDAATISRWFPRGELQTGVSGVVDFLLSRRPDLKQGKTLV